ncbi:hypothetical protein GQ54DRAFT_239218, partial [Martensiomyces pterosporus]
LYKAFIRPALEYGLAALPFSASAAKKLETTQAKVLCSLLSIPAKTSKAAVLRLCEVPPMAHRWRSLATSYARSRTKVSKDHILH